MTVFGHSSPAQQTLCALKQQPHSGPVVWSRKTLKEMREERLTLGKEEGPSPPLTYCLWGGVGRGREAVGQHEGVWEEEPRQGVTCQRPHIEARGTPSLSPVRSAPLLVLTSCPWALCPGFTVSTYPLSQRLANAAMRSWGGVSWRVPDLRWSLGRCTVWSPGPGASVICLLALAPSRKAALPTSQRGLIHLRPQPSTKVEPWLMPWHEDLRLDFKKAFLLKRWDGGIREGGVTVKVTC